MQALQLRTFRRQHIDRLVGNRMHRAREIEEAEILARCTEADEEGANGGAEGCEYLAARGNGHGSGVGELDTAFFLGRELEYHHRGCLRFLQGEIDQRARV